MREITIASEERYSDWSAAVKAELIRRGLDIGDARDAWSFLDADASHPMNGLGSGARRRRAIW